MRAIASVFCSALVILAGCAGREQVRTSYVGTGSMDQPQVTQLLNEQGYADVTDLHKNGSNWVGSANKDGQTVAFDIDKNGNIHTK